MMRVKNFVFNHNKAIAVTLAFITILARIWIATGVPKMIIYGPHDDLYFAKAAYYLIHGQWLGPYDNMTLIKGPFYAFYLVASYLTGLPLFLNETIFYICTCVIFVFSIAPLIKNAWGRLGIFVIMVFVPESLATSWNLRVYREFVYFSLTMWVIASAMGLFLRLDQKLPKLMFWSLSLGLSMGGFMIVHEDSIWIYPIMFLLMITCLIVILIKKLDRRILRAICIIIPVVIWYLPTLAVSYLNYVHYDYWGISENLDPDFNRVLNTLSRIKTNDTWHPAIQISKDARMQAYLVSPIFSSMKDDIEKDVISWNTADDEAMMGKPAWYLSEYGNGGSEVGNGHFVWLLRDVVYNHGYYSGGKYPHALYQQLADQLENACDTGKLSCSPKKDIPLVGSIDQRQIPIALRMFVEGAYHLAQQSNSGLQNLDIRTWPKWPVNNDDYKFFEGLIYNPISEPTIQAEQNNGILVNGKMSVEFTMLIVKSSIMNKIGEIYKALTLPASILAMVMWLILIIMFLLSHQRQSYYPLIILSIYIIGMFISRLMTLSIVDATTSIAGVNSYGASNNIFIYAFILLVLGWGINRAIAYSK